MDYDVIIVGGGPGGSTLGTLLKKYDPTLSVAIYEREKFPREHVGESQLPPISQILDEMGCWDKVEAANFPIKIGVTYRWGKDPELWDFEFLPLNDFHDEPKPLSLQVSGFSIQAYSFSLLKLSSSYLGLNISGFDVTPISDNPLVIYA